MTWLSTSVSVAVNGATRSVLIDNSRSDLIGNSRRHGDVRQPTDVNECGFGGMVYQPAWTIVCVTTWVPADEDERMRYVSERKRA